MKSAKLILIVLLGALVIGSAGCGGCGSSSRSYNDQDALDTAEILERILTPGSDGAPVIFDYAPLPASWDVSSKSLKADNLEYVKYIKA